MNRSGGDAKWEIESAAGKIYEVLKGKGKIPYPFIRQKTDLRGFPFYEAIGWLAREEKVIIHKDKTTYSAEVR